MSSFSSSSFDDLTTTTATNTAPAENTEAQAKDVSQEEAADGTAGVDGLFETLTAAWRRWILLINITQYATIMYHNHRQVKYINLILNNNLILFINIST